MKTVMLLLISYCVSIPATAQVPMANPALEKTEHDRFSRIAERQYGRFVEAYQLDAKTQGWLREELNRRIEASLENTRQTASLTADLLNTRRDPAKTTEIMKQLQEQTSKRPLSLDQISQALKPMIPAEQWQAGRARMVHESKEHAELAQQAEAQEKVPEPAVQIEQPVVSPPTPVVAQPPVAMPAPQISFTPPPQNDTVKEASIVPANKFGQQDQVEAPPPAKIVEKPMPMAKAAPSHGKSPAYQPPTAPPRFQPPVITAPPPSEWEKLVRDTAARYKFTDAQMQTARSILKDCERRADAYRKSHAADFERVGKISEAAKRNDLKAKLDAPINAIGQELRNRLETIPNAQQRAAAGNAVSSKRK